MTETETTEKIKSPLEIGIERYNAGESYDTLIPYFSQLAATKSPDSAALLTCLTWLYLLDNQPAKALKSAQKAYKLNARDPQTLINLSLAMLENKSKGVRQHIDIVQEICLKFPEIKQEIKETLDDGLTRKPDWKNLVKVKDWLFNI
ncbi:MAG TPA: hypothetical protein V6C58_21950 [Allocoleopsis sp.]